MCKGAMVSSNSSALVTAFRVYDIISFYYITLRRLLTDKSSEPRLKAPVRTCVHTCTRSTLVSA